MTTSNAIAMLPLRENPITKSSDGWTGGREYGNDEIVG